jgi:carboxyl-terminal processing protease
LDDALASLKKQNMKYLVIDLRFNTGGLLDQAIRVCDEFLEKGAVIVSTRGRIAESNVTYRSSETNEYENIPMIILVNRGSASASEIVAGAIQDHDRGIIVGTTTWGKGLVQSLYRLGGNTGLALTTARYYTPSGRLIQRDYSKSFYDYYYTDIGVDEDTQNREKAFTETGREVYGGGGITPDVKVEAPQDTKFMALLNSEYAFFNFAKRFTATDERRIQSNDAPDTRQPNLVTINHDFQVDDQVLADFKDFLNKDKIEFTEKEWADNINQIKGNIKQEVFSTVWGADAGYRISIANDPQVQKGLEMLPKAEALLKTRHEKMAKLSQK